MVGARKAWYWQYHGVISHNSTYMHRRPSGGSGSAALRRAAEPHRPLALVGLGAASQTCGTLCETAPAHVRGLPINDP